jgi:DNA-binding IclR family transcriptional regulator
MLTPLDEMSREIPARHPDDSESRTSGLDVLEAGRRGSPAPVPLKQLTDLIGIDRSSVFAWRTRCGSAVSRQPEGEQRLHPRPDGMAAVRRYGRTVLGTFFHHYLQDLSATLGETSHFAVREGRRGVLHRPPHPRRAGRVGGGQTGEFAPLHCTAHGKALLADCDLPPCASCWAGARCGPTPGRP